MLATSTTSVPSIDVRGLSKSYRNGVVRKTRKSVLRDVSLQVPRPMTVAIMGQNGVGKSTFLKVLAGLLEPDCGSVRIGAKQPTDALIGYVPQDNPVMPWLRAIDDIALPLQVAGIRRAERHERVRELVSRFRFDIPLETRGHALSGGQRQVVNLCRALATPRPPDMILLDEPWSSLDVGRRLELANHLHVIRKELDVPICLSTHQVDLAVYVADLVVFFKENPVTVGPEDIISVSLPTPRDVSLMRSQEFLDQVASLEERLQEGTRR